MAARSVSTRGKTLSKWSLDLTSRPKYSVDQRHGQSLELPAPVGYTDKQLPDTDAHEIDDNLVTKKSWDIAIGPLKQIPMTLFIMYMAGNTISLFPIMMVGMMFLKPVKALFSIQTGFMLMTVTSFTASFCIQYSSAGEIKPNSNVDAFATLEGEQSFLMKLVYLFGNVTLLVMALYKCHYMGLLPLSPSDWIEFVEHKERLEFSGGGLSIQS